MTCPCNGLCLGLEKVDVALQVDLNRTLKYGLNLIEKPWAAAEIGSIRSFIFLSRLIMLIWREICSESSFLKMNLTKCRPSTYLTTCWSDSRRQQRSFDLCLVSRILIQKFSWNVLHPFLFCSIWCARNCPWRGNNQSLSSSFCCE